MICKFVSPFIEIPSIFICFIQEYKLKKCNTWKKNELQYVLVDSLNISPYSKLSCDTLISQNRGKLESRTRKIGWCSSERCCTLYRTSKKHSLTSLAADRHLADFPDLDIQRLAATCRSFYLTHLAETWAVEEYMKFDCIMYNHNSEQNFYPKNYIEAVNIGIFSGVFKSYLSYS